MIGVRSVVGRRSRFPAAGFPAIVIVARPWLAGAVAVGIGQALVLVVQAAVLSQLLASALSGGLTPRAAAREGLAVAVLGFGQGLAGWAWETCAERAARRARAAMRRLGLAGAIRLAASGQVRLDRGDAEPRPEAGDRRPRDGDYGPGDHDAGDPGPGAMATLLSSGIDEIDPFVGRVLPRAVLAAAVPVLLLAWIAHLDLFSAGIGALALVIAAVLSALAGMSTGAAVRRRLTGLERLGDRFAALVEGLPLLRAFGRAADHERAVAASGEEVRAATLATLRLALLAGLVLELMAAAGTALVAVPLGLRLDAGQRILPQALAVLMLTPELFLPLRRLLADFHAGATGRAVLARLGRLTAADDQPALPAAGDGRGRAPARPGRPGHRPFGVVLDQVTLMVPGRSRPVLDRIDLRVTPGERVCLVGESGAGKTSLLRVAAGLAAPTAGQARLEAPGTGVGRRPALGWVPQHPTVLAATVLENVTLGRPGIGEEAARAALEAARLGPWVTALPGGMRTPLSGLDAPLSMGERRRLAIARVLAGPAPGLWLLDEPTAGLDREAAAQLLGELARVLDGATALIATHDDAVLPLGQRRVEVNRGRLRDPRPGRPAMSAR